MGEMVSLGLAPGAFDGYLARSNRIGPGVLLLHESFGMIDSFKELADALRDEGFTVLALDLYGGVVAQTDDEAQAIVDSLDGEEVRQRLNSAVEYMQESWHPRLGVIGFSFGAGLAGALAQERPVDATVLYYGLPTIDPARWNGPVLGHFAEEDPRQPLEITHRSFEDLAGAGVEAELYVYSGAGHWFATPGVSDAYVPEAAALAWERTVAFLRHHLS